MAESDPPAATVIGADAPLDLVPLPGSERTPVAGQIPAPGAAAEPTGSAPRTVPPGAHLVHATVVVRRRADIPAAHLSGPGLSGRQFAREFGADPGDIDAVTARFAGLGLQVLSSDAASRRVRVAGSVADMERIFGTQLAPVTLSRAGGVAAHHVRSGGLSIPADLDGIVTAVLGLDDRPQTRALYRVATRAVATSYTPVELGRIYDFPAGTDGSGQSIAIIELGGGFDPAELDRYFGQLGLATPSVTAVGVDGASNQAGLDPGGADGEVLLDIEVAGALAPGADIVVYFAPNTDAGFLDAVSQAAHATPTPAAISVSWGQSEQGWTEQARQAMDDAFVDAAALGATVTVAAGDDGSRDRVEDGAVHVDFPAASPHALACGGTRLSADPASGRVDSETVWNNGVGAGATGGGFSTVFTRPDYQLAAIPTTTGPTATGPTATGRGVPDVAAVADPETGYQILVDGSYEVIGGTSAVAPLWAALIARLAQARGQRFGLIQPLLYDHAAAGQVAAGFRDVTEGTNGAYVAAAGWDACTGLGVPVGSGLAAIIAADAPG